MIENIKQKIRDYAEDLYYRHDLAPWKNEKACKAVEKIVTYCINELSEDKRLVEELNDDSKIEYYVNQTILRML